MKLVTLKQKQKFASSIYNVTWKNLPNSINLIAESVISATDKSLPTKTYSTFDNRTLTNKHLLFERCQIQRQRYET